MNVLVDTSVWSLAFRRARASSRAEAHLVEELAAEFSNVCRKAGVQGSHIDFLICSVAADNGASIFTTDKDFRRYAKHLPITLHVPRAQQSQAESFT